MKNSKTNPVFTIALLLCALIAVWAVAFNDSFTVFSNAVFTFFTVDFGWLYMLGMLAFVVFALFLAFSKYGSIKLGADDSKPEYSTVSWFAMLFGCGMGVGLVFWGISEPISHYIAPAAGIEPGTAEAAQFAFKSSFMHWGIHPWANYSIIGLALAYFQFRKGKPGLISTTLEPLIGEKGATGWLGKLVDILAVFATVAGVVTSLGLGVMQINSGMNYLFGLPSSLVVQIVIIGIISVIYIGTAVSGIEKGIKMISDLNLYIAIGLMLVCFIVGPKLDTLNNLVGGLGDYLQYFVHDSLSIIAYGDNSWVLAWRIFYWAWWIAWAPFVGVFIARISKGRTIREFVGGVVLVPALASIIWFSIFGSMGISLGAKGLLSAEQLSAIASTPETGLFVVMQKYPIGTVLSIIAIVLLCTFFITSANSGTFVLSMLSSKGNLNPPKSKMLIWGIVQSVMAVGMLLAGGLKPLQTISIAAAFPFIFIMFAVMISLVLALHKDAGKKKQSIDEKSGEQSENSAK